MLAKPEQHEKLKEESNPNRIYVQFVANQVNGYPDVDEKNEHLGHLDFDETRLIAKGRLIWPCAMLLWQEQALVHLHLQGGREAEP